jgi:hypothetical protein
MRRCGCLYIPARATPRMRQLQNSNPQNGRSTPNGGNEAAASNVRLRHHHLEATTLLVAAGRLSEATPAWTDSRTSGSSNSGSQPRC